MVTVKEVKTPAELRGFIVFQYRLYKENPFYVPPLFVDEMNALHWKKNPAFEYCEARYWMAFKNGKAAGRVAAIINRRYIEKWGLKLLRFGWIDFIDDAEVSTALMTRVEDWAGELGLDGVHGPLGFCDMDKEGMLIEGFDQTATIITIYNHPYYPAHMERLGYRKDADWLEYKLTVPRTIPENIVRLAEVVKKRSGVSLLHARTSKDLFPYARPVFHLLNETYAHLYGVVELTERQIGYYIRQYFGFLTPEFTKIVLDRDGKIAAFGITLPGLAQAFRKAKGRLFPLGFIPILRAMKKNPLLELGLMAVRKDLQSKGLNAILICEITRACIEHGVLEAESNPELETNSQVQVQWKHFQAKQHKRRRCYRKNL